MKPDDYYIRLEENGYYETIDKRSKDYREYKEWKAIKESYKALKENVEGKPKGLGDTIAKITKATGIDKVVKFIAGDDCGCDERKAIFNKEFRYREVKCLKEGDYKFLIGFFEGRSSIIGYDDKIKVIGIYNYVFGTNEKRTTSCSPCVAKIVKNLKRYMETYK
tara:strand:+ start:123 stop:614 length:492 start_codon:yes stop_codon:yes gene_type:complete